MKWTPYIKYPCTRISDNTLWTASSPEYFSFEPRYYFLRIKKAFIGWYVYPKEVWQFNDCTLFKI